MENNEQQSEPQPSSAMVRDAARLRAVMGESQDGAPPRVEPTTSDKDVSPRALVETHLRLGAVVDAPHSGVAPPADAQGSSATRILSPDVASRSRATAVKDPSPPIVSDARQDDTPTIDPKKVLPLNVNPPAYATPSYAPSDYTPKRRHSGLITVVAIGAGLVVGIGVWVGVGDDLAALFTSPAPQPPVDNPTLITETPASLTSSTQGDSLLLSSSLVPSGSDDPSDLQTGSTTTSQVPSEAHRVVVHESTRDHRADLPEQEPRREAAATPREKSVSIPRPAEVTANAAAGKSELSRVDREESQETPTVRPAVTPSPETERSPSTLAGGARYTVQVRSTTDRREAEGIAQRLRSKGVRNVRVETLRKEGVEMYRVRYGQYASTREAQSEAGKLGQSNIWIVRQP